MTLDGTDRPPAQPSAAQSISAAVVALGFLGLVALIFWRATSTGQNFNDIWAVTGPIVGVVIGVIPSFFFQRQLAAERSRSADLGGFTTALAAASTTQAVRDAADLAPRIAK